MKTFIGIFVLGVIASQVSCQHLGMGAGGMGMPLLGMTEGMSMPEMMLFQSMLNPSSATGGSSGGAAGGGGSGVDPSMLLMLGSGAAGGGMTDMMQTYAMMNMFNGGADHGQGQQGQGQQAQNEQPGMATNIANMLGRSGNPLTVSQQNVLWNTVQISGHAQKIMDAIVTPSDRIQLERDGLPNMNPLIQVASCPRPTNCHMQICENAEMPFTPESLYVCRGCPRCRLESGQQSMLNMLNQMGGAGGGNMAQMIPQMAMARALSGGGGGGGGGGVTSNPAMMMAMMNMQQQQAQQQQQQAQANLQQQIQQPRPSPMPSRGSQPQWNVPQGFPSITENQANIPSQTQPRPTDPVQLPSSGQVPSTFNAQPPPEFIAAMRALSNQMRARGSAGDTRPQQGAQ